MSVSFGANMAKMPASQLNNNRFLQFTTQNPFKNNQLIPIVANGVSVDTEPQANPFSKSFCA